MVRHFRAKTQQGGGGGRGGGVGVKGPVPAAPPCLGHPCAEAIVVPLLQWAGAGAPRKKAKSYQATMTKGSHLLEIFPFFAQQPTPQLWVGGGVMNWRLHPRGVQEGGRGGAIKAECEYAGWYFRGKWGGGGKIALQSYTNVSQQQCMQERHM